MKTALVIGSEGQDGRLLVNLLTDKGYKVYGIGRAAQSQARHITYTQVDLMHSNALAECLTIVYDEIYYLAAYHHSSGSKELDTNTLVEVSYAVNVFPFAAILESLAEQKAKTRVFYASTSLIYGGADTTTQDENTEIVPNCIYSISKKSAMDLADYYRKNYNLFIGVGILYNHESSYRRDEFLSKIIINQTKDFISGKVEKITIGNLSAETDWGYAPDYVEAMWHILQLKMSGNFIISSGKAHKVQDWFMVLFDHLNMDWKQYVEEDKSLVRRKKPLLIGDNSKLLATGWIPKVSFKEMVLRMHNNII